MSRAELSSHGERAERYGPQVDDIYEAQIRAWRAHGHVWDAGFDAIAGLETLSCERCGTVMVEQV